jgi:hypothetical protein
LRIKRSVQAQYNTNVSAISEQLLAERQSVSMVAKPSETFVSAGMTMNGRAVDVESGDVASVDDAVAENPDEIAVDAMDI